VITLYLQKQIVLSLFRQLSAWATSICCLALARLQYGARSAPSDIDRYFLPTRRSAANPPDAVAVEERTDRLTDARPLHRPCSASIKRSEKADVDVAEGPTGYTFSKSVTGYRLETGLPVSRLTIQPIIRANIVGCHSFCWLVFVDLKRRHKNHLYFLLLTLFIMSSAARKSRSPWIPWFWVCATISVLSRDFASWPRLSVDYTLYVRSKPSGAPLTPTWLYN